MHLAVYYHFLPKELLVKEKSIRPAGTESIVRIWRTFYLVLNNNRKRCYNRIMNDEHLPSQRTPAHQNDHDLSGINLNLDTPYISHHDHKPGKPKRKWWPPRMPHGKKEWVITIAIIIALISAGVGAYFIWFKKDAMPVAKKHR